MNIKNLINNKIIFFFLFLLSFFFQEKIYLEFDTNSDKNLRSQIFIDYGEGLSEKNSINFWIKNGVEKHKFRLDKLNNQILSIRFDPENSNQTFSLILDNIKIKQKKISIKDTFQISNANNLNIIQDNNIIKISKINDLEDPNFWISINWKKKKIKNLFELIISFILVIFLINFIIIYIRKYDISFFAVDFTIFFVLTILIFYLSEDITNILSFKSWENLKNNFSTGTNYFYSLANSFLDGKLNLDKPIDPKLLSLKNPYQEYHIVNAEVVYDLSYYKNKYYAYWTPLAGIVIFIFSIIFNKLFFLGDKLIAIIALYFLVFTSRILLGKIFQNKFQVLLASIIILSSLIFIYNIKQLTYPEHGIYQSTVIISAIFINLSLFFLFEKKFTDKIFLIGLFISCIFLSRVSLLFLSIAFFLVYSFKLIQIKKDLITNLSKFIFFPLAFGILLLLYNYLRFENILDFGNNYQIGSHVSRLSENSDKYSIQNFVINFYNYFFKYPFLELSKPYLKFNNILNDFIIVKVLENFFSITNIPLIISCNEPVIGMIWYFPLAFVSIFYYRNLSEEKKKISKLFFIFLIISTIPLFFIYFANLRYGLDFILFVFYLSFLILNFNFKIKVIIPIFLLSILLNIFYINMLKTNYLETSKILNTSGKNYQQLKFKCHL